MVTEEAGGDDKSTSSAASRKLNGTDGESGSRDRVGGRVQGRSGERGGTSERGDRDGEGVGPMDWTGAKYSREKMFELSKSAAALRRPADIPLQFCRDEPGNLAERSKNERAARRKEEREKEKERKDKGAKGGREPRGDGEVLSRGDFVSRELARDDGRSGRGGEPQRSAQPSGPPAGGRGGASAEDRHKLMMEEVERERAAFAAVRNQQKAEVIARKTAAGISTTLNVNRSVFGDNMGGMGGDSGQGILEMLMGGGGDEGINAGMGDMSIQIPLPSVVPPEASPSKFAKSRAGRWFSPAAESGGLAFAEDGAEVPDAVATLWGSPAPAARPAEQHHPHMSAGAMGYNMHQGQGAIGGGAMGGGSGIMGPGMFMSQPPHPGGGGGGAGGGQAPQSTLSQLLNINANAPTQPPSTPTQGSTAQTKINLPTPVAPLARPGNRLHTISVLLHFGAQTSDDGDDALLRKNNVRFKGGRRGILEEEGGENRGLRRKVPQSSVPVSQNVSDVCKRMSLPVLDNSRT